MSSQALQQEENIMNQCDFVGIDISKLKFDAQMLINDKSHHRVFENNLSGCKAFLAWINKYSQDAWVCMESTGHYSELLADFLHTQKIKVSVVNPFQIKHFAKAKLNRNKNDKLDAKTIREFGAVMRPALYVPRPARQKQAREHVQLLDSLKKQRTQLKNQLESISSKSIKKEIHAIINALSKRIDKLEKQLVQLVKEDEVFFHAVELLKSIQGLGFISAISLLAYLPDITYFKNAKQLAAFIGVSPRQRESGQFVGKTCLSKFGNSRLRAVLYMPALTLKKASSFFYPFVQRLERNGLKPKAIVGALMRKLVHIIFGVLKSNRPFDPVLV